MTASEFNASGSRGRAGTGASTSSSGQINAAQAGIKEVDEPGIDWHNHTSYWDKQPSGTSTKGSGGGGATSSSQVPVHERVPM